MVKDSRMTEKVTKKASVWKLQKYILKYNEVIDLPLKKAM